MHLQELTSPQHPFLPLGGQRYIHAFCDSYLHLPTEGRSDGAARVCKELLDFKQSSSKFGKLDIVVKQLVNKLYINSKAVFT